MILMFFVCREYTRSRSRLVFFCDSCNSMKWSASIGRLTINNKDWHKKWCKLNWTFYEVGILVNFDGILLLIIIIMLLKMAIIPFSMTPCFHIWPSVAILAYVKGGRRVAWPLLSHKQKFNTFLPLFTSPTWEIVYIAKCQSVVCVILFSNVTAS